MPYIHGKIWSGVSVPQEREREKKREREKERERESCMLFCGLINYRDGEEGIAFGRVG